MSKAKQDSAGCGCLILIGLAACCWFNFNKNTTPVPQNQGFQQQQQQPGNPGVAQPQVNPPAASWTSRLDWPTLAKYAGLGALLGVVPGACVALLAGLISGRAGEKARAFGPLPWHACASSIDKIRQKYYWP